MKKAELAILVHQFSLNYFSSTAVPICCFIYDGANIVGHIVDRYDLHDADLHNQTLPSDVWARHAIYLEFAYGRVSAAPAAEVMIGRICRAFRNGPTPDGIIDLAIALECLIQTNTEIKFQFALYNALINQSDLTARSDLFQLLQSLYDVRSANVHGARPTAAHKNTRLTERSARRRRSARVCAVKHACQDFESRHLRREV